MAPATHTENRAAPAKKIKLPRIRFCENQLIRITANDTQAILATRGMKLTPKSRPGNPRAETMKTPAIQIAASELNHDSLSLRRAIMQLIRYAAGKKIRNR